MDMRIYYVILSMMVFKLVDLCEESVFDCSITITCDDIVDSGFDWQRFIQYNDPNHIKCKDYVLFHNNFLKLVTLEYKQQSYDTTNPLPNTNFDYGTVVESLKIIHTLDLSKNSFQETPVIQEMMHLSVLNISHNALTKALLSNTYELSELTKLDLSNNMINDIVVNDIEHPYRTLISVDLSHNYIANVPDAIFDPFDNLQILDLSYNYIDILNQFTFEGIKKMTDLNLSNNRLTDINSALFRFSELITLDLSSNKIQNLKVTDFQQLVKLKVLDLSSNSIKFINNNIFSTTVSLTKLDLKQNQLNSLDRNAFSNLLLLNDINLSTNEIKTLPIGLFKKSTIFSFSIVENKLEGILDRGMFEGIDVTTLDLGNQRLSEIRDYSFYNLHRLDTLILKSNALSYLKKYCFKTLISLQLLDLSYNHITDLNFDKEDLKSLQSFSLKNNRMTAMKLEYFQNLTNLEYLDISENQISHLGPNAFQMLNNLVSLKLNRNPLVGTLETATFHGLVLLPSLDISNTMLTTVQNATFNEMTALKELNMSFCEISDLKYNAFAQTGYIEILDLSHNKLEEFFVNTTELIGLSTLLLHNNLIKVISTPMFNNLGRLNKITISHNTIVNVHDNSFNNLVDLRYLDLSYNQKINLSVSVFEKVEELNTLILSGIKVAITFSNIVKDNHISVLVMADASIHNISQLHLGTMLHIETLDLSHNNVTQLQIGDFSELTALRHLDLSYNEISFIQSGIFKNNTVMISLNLSHNYLSSVGYGIFRGLFYLNLLDMSYNKLKYIQSEQLYELNYLTNLIVDHNDIASLNAEEFDGTSLTKLSIGENPLPCEVLVRLTKQRLNFEITAIKKDEHKGENVNGVTCNKLRTPNNEVTILKTDKNSTNIELSGLLRNILYNISRSTIDQNREVQYLENISTLLETSNTVIEKKLSNLINLTASIQEMKTDNKIFFKEILELFHKKSFPPIFTTLSPPHTVTQKTTNAPPTEPSTSTFDIISYINKIKKDLENAIANENKLMRNFERKFIENRTESFPLTNVQHEKFISAKNEATNNSLFTEICVALILCIMVGLLLYKFYKSRMFVSNRFSISTRELPGAMENSAL